MFSSKGLTQRRKGAKSVLVLFIVLTIMFMGCSLDDDERIDTGFIPEGEWVSYDSYTITKTALEYFMEGSEWEGFVFPDTILKGAIERAVDFSDNAGVLIIKITETSDGTVGNYTGVYYSDYTQSSIKLATAFVSMPAFAMVETTTLNEALTVFTVDNAGTHVSVWGTYTK